MSVKREKNTQNAKIEKELPIKQHPLKDISSIAHFA